MAPSHAYAIVRLYAKHCQGKRRPGIELRNHRSGVPILLDDGEGNTGCGVIQRVAHRPRGVRDPVHAWTLY
ncbi:MAG: hypothetical protein KJ823_06765, partial [Proteobacteria bacterium]|nr:hypothetical protein [Pseudomonadota bacterium]